MNLWRPVVVVALLQLGGCAALSGFGGGIASLVGAGVSESIEEKRAVIALWKIEKARLNAKIIDRMEMEADKLFAADKPTEGIAMLREIIAEHDKNQPLWLIQKFIRRAESE